MIFLIFGRRKSGKTTLAIAASYYAAADGLVYVYDPVRQWPDEYERTPEQLYAQAETNRLVVLRQCEAADVATIALQAPPCVAVFDEIDLLCSAGHWKSEEAHSICLRGRHWESSSGRGVGIIITGQRPNSCHTDLRALTDKIAVFHSNYPDDLDIYERWLGPEYRQAIEKLPEHHFVLWPDGLVCKVGIGGQHAVEHSLAP